MRWAVGPAAGGKINRTMYLTPEELKSHMYAHIVEEITEGDEQIVLQAIEAAVEQLLCFEKGSKIHDDAPDALEGAIWKLSNSVRKTNNRYAVGRRASRRW